MTDAEYEHQKARIQSLIDRWVKVIGLGWWHIKLDWMRRYHKADLDFDQRDKITVFECYSDWRYLHASITVYLPAVTDVPDDGLEKLFVHELMHVFLSELRQEDETGVYQAHEERVATTLANAFVWHREALVCEQPHIGDGAPFPNE